MLIPDAVRSGEERQHPARMAWRLAERIVGVGQTNGWWRAGSRIGCPMAGEGTELLNFRRAGCDVYGIEIEPAYYARLNANMAHMDTMPPMVIAYGEYRVVNGDATLSWPSYFDGLDAVVFSPTYDAAIRVGAEGPYAKSKWEMEVLGKQFVYKPQVGYGHTPGQVGDMNGVDWRNAMRLIYRQAYRNVRGGGYLVTVTKDCRKDHQHYPIADITVEDALSECWSGPVAWYRAQGASRSTIARWLNRRYAEAGQYDLVINHEDIVVFQKLH